MLYCWAAPPFVPAQAGTQGPHSLTKRLGPRFRGGERRKTDIHLSNSQASSPPGLVGLGVGPSLLPSPQTRGCGAPEQTPRRKTRLSSAPPAFPAFAFHGARTRTSPVVAGGVLPGSARGCSCEPHPQVPVPAPLSRRLMKAPLDGRDLHDLG